MRIRGPAIALKYHSELTVNAKSERKAIAAVQNAIFHAFAGVALNHGVGLSEGLEIDSYADVETRSAARASDEKNDWTAIPASELNGAATSLAYFDAAGMRFHLPAYLIADLRGHLDQDVLFHLIHRGLDDRYSLSSEQQRAAVRSYLALQLELLPQPNRQFQQQSILETINGFWSESSA